MKCRLLIKQCAKKWKPGCAHMAAGLVEPGFVKRCGSLKQDGGFMRIGKILVLGGVRSGKSFYAQNLVEASGRPRIFIATGEARDPEMAERIAHHQAGRGPDWQTVETPLALAEAIRERGAHEAVLVDCLTLWLSNLMLAGIDPEPAIDELCATIAAAPCALALVSNEVGMGIVPEHPLGRQFRDWQGRLNQMAARACDAAVFMVAGCPLLLKPSQPITLTLG